MIDIVYLSVHLRIICIVREVVIVVLNVYMRILTNTIPSHFSTHLNAVLERRHLYITLMQEIKMLDMRSHVSNLTIEDISCCMERASSAHVALLKKGNNGRICIKETL